MYYNILLINIKNHSTMENTQPKLLQNYLLEQEEKIFTLKYGKQLKKAIRQKNICAAGIVTLVFFLGVAIGVLFNSAIVQFIESLTKNFK